MNTTLSEDTNAHDIDRIPPIVDAVTRQGRVVAEGADTLTAISEDPRFVPWSEDDTQQASMAIALLVPCTTEWFVSKPLLPIARLGDAVCCDLVRFEESDGIAPAGMHFTRLAGADVECATCRRAGVRSHQTLWVAVGERQFPGGRRARQ